MTTIRPLSMPMSVVMSSFPSRRASRRMRSIRATLSSCWISPLSPLLPFAQIGLHDCRVGAQVGGAARLADCARLQHVGAVGDGERQCRQLVDEPDRGTLP